MIKGITKGGFEFEIPEEKFNDMRVMDCLRAMNELETDENVDQVKMIFAVSELTEILLGKKGRKKLYDHLQTDKGQVPIEAVIDEVMEIFNVSNRGN